MDPVLTPEQEGELERVFRSLTNHTPSPEVIEEIEQVRFGAKLLAESLIRKAHPSRERSLALTHLEETVMWGVKALILDEVEHRG